MPLESSLITVSIAEAGKLLPHLFMFSEEHRKEGKQLQKDILRFQEEFQHMIDDVWAEQPASLSLNDGDQASKVEKDEGNKPKPPKPSIPPQNWTIRFWL